jgi:hypothetical protein
VTDDSPLEAFRIDLSQPSDREYLVALSGELDLAGHPNLLSAWQRLPARSNVGDRVRSWPLDRGLLGSTRDP